MVRRRLVGAFIPTCGVGGVEQFFSELIQQEPLRAYNFHVSFFKKDRLCPIFQERKRVKGIPEEKLEWAFRKFPYDLWVTFGPLGSAACLGQKYHVPHIWILVSSFAMGRLDLPGSRGQVAQKLFSFLSSRIVAISRFTRSELSFTCPAPVDVIHWGCNPDRFQDAEGRMRESFRKEFELGPMDFTIGMIANFTPQKRQHTLLKALRLLSKETTIKCFFVGGPFGSSHYMKEVILMKEDFGMKTEIFFTGIRRDIPRVLAGLDAVILPSEREGFGLAILEGMAAGKPVIATQSGAFPEFVEHGRNGLLVPLDDPESLAEAILKLKKNAELRERFGETARHMIYQKFHIRDVALRYKDVFESVINSH